MFEIMPRRYNVTRRVNPYSVFSLMDDFFNDDFFNENKNVTYGIRTDVKENDKEYILEAELPGFNKEDIVLETTNEVLTIKASKNLETKEEKDGYLRRERRCGQFERSFSLDGVDKNAINASYDNGVLKVTLPKQEVKVEENKRIEIT
ncbi:MAG: Hsp20/alpha crystallin family protein [Clostridia bacterium]|nr:Hsp20/alpha crystallin family protein [Clostridia bacterium]